MAKKIEYGIVEVTRYQIQRHESAEVCGSLECFGEFQSLETAERVAKRFSELEGEGATWFTVPR